MHATDIVLDYRNTVQRILKNRIDACMMKEVRQQHMENNLSFLTERLKVVDERTPKERVYFVSAKEVLIMRMRQMANEQNVGKLMHRVDVLTVSFLLTNGNK